MNSRRRLPLVGALAVALIGAGCTSASEQRSTEGEQTPVRPNTSTASPAPTTSATPAPRPTPVTPRQRARADAMLLAAAESGSTTDAVRALRAGARLETRNELRQTPLLLAAANDRVAVARLLVLRGADPDALDHRHDTPWLVTGVTGSVGMLETLLPARPDLTIRNRFGGLSPIPAAERGHVEYIRRVVRTAVDLDHVNDSGWTALLEAVILGDGGRRHQQVVRLLVDAGVDTSIGDRDGVTALQHARARGYTKLAAILGG